jgi:hypothetical protein
MTKDEFKSATHVQEAKPVKCAELLQSASLVAGILRLKSTSDNDNSRNGTVRVLSLMDG